MKNLSKKEYPTPYWTVHDLIKAAVNKEAERFIHDLPRELRPDTRPHKAQWSEIVKKAFSQNITAFLP